MNFIWQVKIKPKMFFILATVAIILSLALVIGELIILFEIKVSIFWLIPNTTGGYLT